MLTELQKARTITIKMVSKSSDKFNESKTSLQEKADSSMYSNEA